MGARACTISVSGRGAAWLARLLGVQEVPSSNLGGPTMFSIAYASLTPVSSRNIPHKFEGSHTRTILLLLSEEPFLHTFDSLLATRQSNHRVETGHGGTLMTCLLHRLEPASRPPPESG